jgi:hypothetical protein
MSTLLELAARCEAAMGADKALNREIALAVGWHRYSPTEIGKSNPGWIAPEDFIGEYVGKDGRRTPKLDSMHGTSIWREPRDYLASIDAAMTLVPEGCWAEGSLSSPASLEVHSLTVFAPLGRATAATPALALTAAALRARAQTPPVSEVGR